MIHLPHDTSTVRAGWDFGANGGRFARGETEAAKAFFAEHGFVVFDDVMLDDENAAAKDALRADLQEINPSTAAIGDLSGFAEGDLPTSPNHTFRTTCNMAFGRFARYVRNHDGVRSVFAAMHGVRPAELGCSWDNPFYTPRSDGAVAKRATQLHWDRNAYYAGERAPMADELCVQGVYYATPTSMSTPSFVLVPGSSHRWRALCECESNPSKRGARVLNYLPLSELDAADVARARLAPCVRVHVPARSLLLWDSKTLHGNAPAIETSRGGGVGRVAFAICYGPVSMRSAAVHKEALLKGLAGIRTTHHPAIMLAHDKQCVTAVPRGALFTAASRLSVATAASHPRSPHAASNAAHRASHRASRRSGYPASFVQNDEPNAALRPLHIALNAAVTELEFASMAARSAPSEEARRQLAALSLGAMQRAVFESYWADESRARCAPNYFELLLRFKTTDLRRLMHPDASRAQGTHRSERAEADVKATTAL